jgi:hypothetical protein
MKTKRPYQWYLSSNSILPIQLHSPDLFVWIGVNAFGEVRTVGVYDTTDLDLHEDQGFVIMRQDDLSFAGEFRPLVRTHDEIKDADPSKFKWMTLEDKERMLALMRKALSLRGCPLPTEFKKIWEVARQIVENLDVINPGLKRYA